jgi:hypothetical protein
VQLSFTSQISSILPFKSPQKTFDIDKSPSTQSLSVTLENVVSSKTALSPLPDKTPQLSLTDYLLISLTPIFFFSLIKYRNHCSLFFSLLTLFSDYQQGSYDLRNYDKKYDSMYPTSDEPNEEHNKYLYSRFYLTYSSCDLLQLHSSSIPSVTLFSNFQSPKKLSSSSSENIHNFDNIGSSLTSLSSYVLTFNAKYYYRSLTVYNKEKGEDTGLSDSHLYYVKSLSFWNDMNLYWKQRRRITFEKFNEFLKNSVFEDIKSISSSNSVHPSPNQKLSEDDNSLPENNEILNSISNSPRFSNYDKGNKNINKKSVYSKLYNINDKEKKLKEKLNKYSQGLLSNIYCNRNNWMIILSYMEYYG